MPIFTNLKNYFLLSSMKTQTLKSLKTRHGTKPVPWLFYAAAEGGVKDVGSGSNLVTH